MEQEKNNLEIWKKFNKPPVEALREIKSGRMRGKSDINPTWRLQAMTEAFGPCGIGWQYTIDKLWLEPGSDGQICAFALVSVCVKTDESWSEKIPGIGGSMLVAKEKAGPYTSDEAYKMAVTDALSVAFKALGVAAEIYLGNFDGGKYKEPPVDTEEVAVKIKEYADECDKEATIEGIKDWWVENKDRIKKDIGVAAASEVYKHVKENVSILEKKVEPY